MELKRRTVLVCQIEGEDEKKPRRSGTCSRGVAEDTPDKVRMELQGAQMKEIEHEAELHSLCTELYLVRGSDEWDTQSTDEEVMYGITKEGNLDG